MKQYSALILSMVLLLVMCKPQVEIQEERTLQKESVNTLNEVIVELKDVKFSKSITNDFEEYDLIFSKQLMPTPPMFLYRFDSSKIEGEELLKKLRASSKVKECQLNRKVSPR